MPSLTTKVLPRLRGVVPVTAPLMPTVYLGMPPLVIGYQLPLNAQGVDKKGVIQHATVGLRGIGVGGVTTTAEKVHTAKHRPRGASTNKRSNKPARKKQTGSNTAGPGRVGGNKAKRGGKRSNGRAKNGRFTKATKK